MEFHGKNDIGTKVAFEEKALYKEYSFASFNNLDLTDFLYLNPFYGRIDNKGYSVFPDERFLKTYEVEDEIYGLNFVVDAFNAFAMSFKIQLVERFSNRTIPESQFVNLEPKKSWVSFRSEYYDYQEQLYQQFFDIVANNIVFRKKICDFKSFLKSYFWFLEKTAPSVPITAPAFVLSKYCSPNVSGLIIELEDTLRADEDDVKKDSFFDDPLFDIYVASAAKYGFSVDKNMPWRLVARINQPQMKFFMSLNDVKRQDFFEKYYLKTHIDDYNNFKDNSLQFYNSFIESFPNDTYTFEHNNEFVAKVQDRFYATQEDIDKMGEIYWLKKYFLIRSLEKYSDFNMNKHKIREKQIIKHYRRVGLQKALNKMEKLFSKHSLEALPKIRKKLYDYGIFNATHGVYLGKTPKTLSEIIKNNF